MKTVRDPDCLLREGLAAIRLQYQLPGAFPPAVEAEAEEVARRRNDGHADRTALPFVTLDPAESRDLDQAFAIEATGGDLLLHYAIADVGWFVADGGAMDAEAWRRGTSQYLPDGKVPLYPPLLSEGAASLLPDGERPAVIFTVRVDGAGEAKLDGVERARIRSRAKLAYETATEAQLPRWLRRAVGQDRGGGGGARRGAGRAARAGGGARERLFPLAVAAAGLGRAG